MKASTLADAVKERETDDPVVGSLEVDHLQIHVHKLAVCVLGLDGSTHLTDFVGVCSVWEEGLSFEAGQS